MIDDHNLDALLSAPLENVADNGFSLQIAGRIERQETWSERFTWGIPALAACALAPFLPLHEFTDTFLRLGPAIAGSAALSVAVAALILTFSFEQRFRDWQSAL